MSVARKSITDATLNIKDIECNCFVEMKYWI